MRCCVGTPDQNSVCRAVTSLHQAQDGSGVPSPPPLWHYWGSLWPWWGRAPLESSEALGGPGGGWEVKAGRQGRGNTDHTI